MNNDTYDYNNYEIDNNESEIRQEEAPEEPSSRPSRRKKKVRVKKKRKKKYYGLKFAGLVVLCVLLYFLAHSAAFTVKNIELEENDWYSLEYVQDFTGMKTGGNLFEMDLGAYEDKLEERPYIEEAAISRKLPDTVKISLTLRRPVSVVTYDGAYVTLDKNGIVLQKSEELPRYTVFAGLTVQEAEPGQVVKIKEEKKYNEYVSLLNKMNKADLYFREMAIDDDTIKLYVKSNLYCTGSKENIVAGMEDGNLKSVLYALYKKGVDTGVVEVGDDQYYSYKKASN